MSIQVPTHHITAQPGEFAKTVIMPGDPLRAKYIAETFLENVKQINSVRCMYAYTGTYKGVPVSVMAHGIGAPSIYAHVCELFDGYGVENIIRVGTAGGLSPEMPLRQMVVAMGACYNSSIINPLHYNATYTPVASYKLMKRAIEAADELKVAYQVGNVFSSDTFYAEDGDNTQSWLGSLGCLAVEMEAAPLYYAAARFKKNALALLTVSDNVVTGEKTSAEERQTTFTGMMKVALETAITL